MAAQTLSATPAAVQTGTTAPAATNMAQYPMASLYVGDLHNGVTESMLYNKFSQAGPVLSIRVCRDAITRRSLGYAYVNFQQPADGKEIGAFSDTVAAERALDTMNFDSLNGKPIRIMWSQRDPTIRRSGAGNVFIKNLDPNIDTKSIYDTFSMFGNILSCKIASDEEGGSKGYGFIHFETEEAAQKAIEKVNGMLLDGKQVYVGKFQPRAARLREMGEAAHRFTNVFVKNFGDKFDDAKFRALFEKYGPITSAVVMKDSEGKPKGFGFVAYERPEDAERAVNELNNYDIPDSELKMTVCRAQKKAEREAELSRVYEQLKAERMQRYQGVNLYVKNLDDSVDSEELRRNFEQYGAIASAKVMSDENGRSKGFGFVCFEKPDDATKAVVDMNNKMLNGKPLYVALAQRKEERKAQLASQYMQRMASMRLQGGAGVPAAMYPSAAGFYVQSAMPGQRPFVAANAIPAQLRAGNIPRWNGMNSAAQFGTMQGFVQQNQFASHRGPRQQANIRAQFQAGARPQNRAAGAVPGANQQLRQPLQQAKTGQSYGYPAAQQVRPQLAHGQTTGVQREELTSKLASAPPQEQKQILGEQLYPMISQMCSEDMVGKITGMLLEMENSELLMCLENQELLQERVNEATGVLLSNAQKATA